PPPLPNRRSGPSVSDYPPPAQLFQTSTAQPPAASDLVRQAPPPPRPRGSQTSATEQPPPCQSHASSQAQNSDSTQSQMRVLNGLLSQPGRERYTQVLSPTFEPGTTWFGRDKGRLSRKIRKICTNKFDDPFYSWSVVPTDDDNELFLKAGHKRSRKIVAKGYD
uniref:Uncharacterized protein n=1 Tax=Brassica oleracea var. oleracea TaxID=109376 RepID=A0A0D3C7S6_BRAOL